MDMNMEHQKESKLMYWFLAVVGKGRAQVASKSMASYSYHSRYHLCFVIHLAS